MLGCTCRGVLALPYTVVEYGVTLLGFTFGVIEDWFQLWLTYSLFNLCVIQSRQTRIETRPLCYKPFSTENSPYLRERNVKQNPEKHRETEKNEEILVPVPVNPAKLALENATNEDREQRHSSRDESTSVTGTTFEYCRGLSAGSLDTLTSICQTSSNVDVPGYEPLSSSKSQEKMDIVDDERVEATSNDKKLISRSSPAIHVSVARSDTFVREEEEKKMSKIADSQENDATICEDKMKSQKFLKKIESLRESVLTVLSKVDDVKEEVCPQSRRHIRRLSAVGVSGINRITSMKRPTQPPKLRRSSTGLPGTPTSSKYNATLPVNKMEGSARRKSISTTTSIQTRPAKLSPNRSPVITSTASKKSTSSGDRPAKNPKYAHIQSTIPKVSVSSKKT
ncbi:hypothetical protein WH47_00513 [Habropoda laboriosa]|uniref:Uncharacterized protein n=1 Tax=Habropoda laboriosa TaxID=597456 RepID=A0A0L7R3W7_9HYME|nr:hypothetical protein WH47_00513 [Habropoda laboriosa]